jgi:hypothetical protein
MVPIQQTRLPLILVQSVGPVQVHLRPPSMVSVHVYSNPPPRMARSCTWPGSPFSWLGGGAVGSTACDKATSLKNANNMTAATVPIIAENRLVCLCMVSSILGGLVSARDILVRHLFAFTAPLAPCYFGAGTFSSCPAGAVVAGSPSTPRCLIGGFCLGRIGLL